MKILIIEDDKFYSKNLQKEIIKQLNYEVDVVNNTKDLKTKNIENYDLIISDIFMEDYSLDYIKEHIIPKTPVILVTGFPAQVLKKQLESSNAIDFIIKTESNQFSQIIDKLKILKYIKDRSFLVVDDSKTATLINLLSLKKHYPFSQIYTAKNGVEALQQIQEHPEIKLILTDYEMPEMDGLTFVKKMRQKYNLNEKIIIAISSANDYHISTTLLKIGANDFLTKPFVDAELVCRCDNNFKIAMLMDEIQDLAYKDSLTGLYNRRYFFDIANKMYLTSLRNKKPISVIMCDIDHFKKINDEYGHQLGDLVIQNTANILKNSVRKNDIVARYGGEEFVIFLYDCNEVNSIKIGEHIRSSIEKHIVNEISYTISIGITSQGVTLEEMINNADKNLYKAKETRNKVIAD